MQTNHAVSLKRNRYLSYSELIAGLSYSRLQRPKHWLMLLMTTMKAGAIPGTA
jgi:hypothetical protein